VVCTHLQLITPLKWGSDLILKLDLFASSLQNRCLFGPMTQLTFACCVGFCPRIWPALVVWARANDARVIAQRRAAAGIGARV
jgi:hypothetical protein